MYLLISSIAYFPSPGLPRPPAPRFREEALPSGALPAPMRPVSSRKGRGRVPLSERQPSPLPHASSRKRGRQIPHVYSGPGAYPFSIGGTPFTGRRLSIIYPYSLLPSVAAYRAAASVSPVNARLTASGNFARASPAQGSSSGSAPA